MSLGLAEAGEMSSQFPPAHMRVSIQSCAPPPTTHYLTRQTNPRPRAKAFGMAVFTPSEGCPWTHSSTPYVTMNNFCLNNLSLRRRLLALHRPPALFPSASPPQSLLPSSSASASILSPTLSGISSSSSTSAATRPL